MTPDPGGHRTLGTLFLDHGFLLLPAFDGPEQGGIMVAPHLQSQVQGGAILVGVADPAALVAVHLPRTIVGHALRIPLG